MQLTQRRLTLHYHHEFRIARGGSHTADTLLVEIEHDGRVGRGEGIPIGYLGWTLDSMSDAVSAMGELLAGRDPAHVDALSEDLLAAFPDQRSAVCAVTGALWDLHGQAVGRPVHELLGLDPGRCGLTSFTIGLASREAMLAKADEAEQYPILKVKCGGPGDLDNVRALAEHTGKPMWVDANCGWSVDQAADIAGRLAELGVAVIEQPVPAGDGDAERLARVREVSPLPVLADESCPTVADVPRLCGAVDGVNVKLDKVGGLSAGLRAIHAARACGMSIMLGCFGASSVSLTAAAQLTPLVDYPDLDGHLLVADDPFRGMIAPNGRITLPQTPGLGLERRA
jgi:L-alanine-DL-glutamate epimerase-like enolase superfamily enzyme